MAINSRAKGAKNERNIAKVFEKWSGKKFAKTPASGGLNWKTTNVAGDIVCTDEGHYFPFCIEAKSYNKIDFSHLLNPHIKNCDIVSFWAQAQRDAKKANKIPILMMRYNGLPKEFYFLALPLNYMIELGKLGLSLPTHPVMIMSISEKEGIAIMPSSQFFQLPYKELRKLTKNLLKNAKR